jgi:MFS family permease
MSVAAVALFIVFIIRERKISYPIIDLNLFRDRLFTLGVGSRALQAIGLGGFIFLTPFFLIDGLGYSAFKTGYTYMLAPLATTLMAPLTGWLADKVSTRVLCTAGMAVLAAGFVLFSRFNAASTLLSMLPAFAGMGIGMALFQAPNASLIMGSVSKDKLGVASAVMNTMAQIGMFGGMTVFGLVLTSRQAGATARLALQNLEPEALYSLSVIAGFQDAILGAAIASFIGIFVAAFAAGKQHK